MSLAHPGAKNREGQGRESGEALVLDLKGLKSHWGSGRKKYSLWLLFLNDSLMENSVEIS